MFDTFLLSFRLKNTYRTNSILFGLKSFPLLGRLFPSALYASRGLKTFALVISLLVELIGTFLGKFLYVGALLYLPLNALHALNRPAFFQAFLFLTVIGALLNTNIFEPTKDKFYALFLMRMDAKRYVLTGYVYFLLRMLVGFFPALLLFGGEAGLAWPHCLLLALFVVGVKCCAAALSLSDDPAKRKVRNENNLTKRVLLAVALLLAAAYVPLWRGLVLPEQVFYGAAAVALLGGAAGFRRIWRFGDYRALCKELLTPETLLLTAANTGETAQKGLQKKLDVTADADSGKTGYAYFNDLFMKRHRKLLTRSAKRVALGSAVFFALAIAACLVYPQAKGEVNGLLLTFLPYFLFIMYLINRGRVITQAMFMNCDHGMLTYRFYRQPKVILHLFAARLRSVTLINLLPASVIAVGLPALLFVTGGTDQPLNYLVLFASILAMSTLFSVHYMVLYYLLQPYNMELEMKNPVYSVCSSLTYVVCYVAIGKEAPTLLFGTAVVAFTLLYTAVALLLAYRLAPKTFRLRP